MSDLFFIGGNQLFPPDSLNADRDTLLVMVESEAYCRRMPFHQQKLGFVLSAMRNHADALKSAGFNIRYFSLSDGVSVSEAIAQTAKQVGARRLLHFDSEDRTLTNTLAGSAESLGMRLVVMKSPMFLTDNDNLDKYFAEAKRPRMASFYRTQRLRMKLLLNGDRPLGGRWSFDTQNRARLPKTQKVPELPIVRQTNTTSLCLQEVAARFPEHPGNAADLWLPTDRSGALDWLDRFLEERLFGFGTYEDALTMRSPTLFHSVLSPFLNVGLITPNEVVTRTLDAAETLQVALNDLEGFLRQIVGWREFVRGIYRHHRQTMRRRNVWGGTRALTAQWYSASTGLDPLDRAIGTARDYAWNHHIERLMVIANLMNLAEIHPDEVYQFFMTHYIDAYDWVMVPNVFGMGLTSDGGIFTSKPYICGSNYIRRMSDYPKGDWTEVMDGLYWRFVAKHRPLLASNPRLAMISRRLDTMDRPRLRRIRMRAEQFLEENTRCNEQ